MNEIEQIALCNQQRAWEIIRDTRLIEIWREAGAEARPVGSLPTGLMMNHLDIDFHIYSDPVTVANSFAAMTQLSQDQHITHIEYTNLLATEEQCIEWHAFYRDTDSRLWQIDMIHIQRGSAYDGYFEHVAERINAVMTDSMRRTILELKYATPSDRKIMGIEYYRAVIEGRVENWQQFDIYRAEHPVEGIVEWIP